MKNLFSNCSNILQTKYINNFMRYYFVLIFLILLNLVSTHNFPMDSSVIEEKINWLYQRLMKNYWNKNQKYVYPIVKWEHQKGLFESKVHFNYLDKRNTKAAAFIRDEYFKIDDINMFVTSFILYGLVQAEQLGTIKIDHHMLSESIMAISSFRDKNTPDGIPQYTFWPQTKINGTWSAQAKNLVHAVDLIPQPPKFMDKFLIKIGLSVLTQARSLTSAFCIPGDNDDSSVNLALMGMLKESNSPHFEFWNSLNLKKQAFYDRALRYAYRPFTSNYSLNKHANEIDPRTYFVLRQFIDLKKKQSENPSLILPTTWLINTEEQVPNLVVMPFKSNNVDASVAANFLFGLCYQIINKEVTLNDQLTQMMMNTVQLLEFTVTHILNKRPTLILVYYPSKYDFFWFIARVVGLLKRHELVSPLTQVKVRLQKLMKEVSTKQIISNAVKSENGYKWKQFLGNYANKQRQQDAIFSSSLALNALLDTWTIRKGSNLAFDEDITEQVKKTLDEGVKYLIGAIKPKMKELNAFFSGSLKIFNNTFPYYFPSNYALDGKNAQIDPTNLTLKNLTFSTKVFVKGFIEPQKYQQMLTKKWFGNEVPQEEISLNTGRGLTFPFWSSRAITQVMAISSLSKYLKATQKKDMGKSIRIEQQNLG